MVSKRQVLARKRYKEANPELFPKPESTPPKDPNMKMKKKTKSNFKRKKSYNSKETKTFRSKFSKHPLRVPGMKPGESCYICKALDHIAKHCPEKAQWEKNKICLLCRHRGHSLKNCPNKNDETMDKKLCYNCGETGHSLAMCTQPLQDGGTKFANCFICNQRGHLSKNCPQNTHGIYPKGGGCKVCGGVTHLAKDCPNKGYRGYNSAASGVSKICGLGSGFWTPPWPPPSLPSLSPRSTEIMAATYAHHCLNNPPSNHSLLSLSSKLFEKHTTRPQAPLPQSPSLPLQCRPFKFVGDIASENERFSA